MVGRAPNEEKQALARIRGLFKKANELSMKCDIKTFPLVEDDHAMTNPVTWSYPSLETFPSQLGFSAHHRFGPSDFITVSEYRREASAQAGKSSFPIPKFDDADLALLQAVAYTPRGPRPTTHPHYRDRIASLS
jgi:hypothetical protein